MCSVECSLLATAQDGRTLIASSLCFLVDFQDFCVRFGYSLVEAEMCNS